MSKIRAETIQFIIYFSVFISLSTILLITPNSFVDNFITYLLGVFSVITLLQMAYIEKLIKDKKRDKNEIP